MRENRVYTIVHVYICSKLINYTTSTRDSCLNDLLLSTPDRFYSAQIIKKPINMIKRSFFLSSLTKREISS